MRALLFICIIGLVQSTPTNQQSKTGQSVIGARKLSTTNDCVSVVAFSGIGAQLQSTSGQVKYKKSLLDKGVGWSKDSGEFTCHCPGLYQFSFSGTTKLILKKKESDNDTWTNIVSTSDQGGSNTVLLDMEIGDKAAVFKSQDGKLEDDEKEPVSSFNGYRIAKK